MQMRILFFLNLLLFVGTGLPQDKTKTLTPEMVVALRFVSDVKMDPSGKNIAYIFHKPRSPEDKPGGKWSELWVASLDGAKRQFTSSDYRVASMPEWTPDGRAIAFRSKRVGTDDRIQVYMIPFHGGEATQITHSKSAVRSFRWSPDGRWLAYTATDGKTEEEKEAEKRGRDWKVVDRHFRHHRLWALEIASGVAHEVVKSDITVWRFEWGPNSERLLVQASTTPKTDASYMFKTLYTVSVKDGELSPLTTTPGKLGSMAWSPNGEMIAFLGGVDKSDPSLGGLFVVSSSGGEAKNLLQSYQGTPVWLTWQDDQTLFFTSVEATSVTFNSISVKSGRITKTRPGHTGFFAASFAKDKKRFACAVSSNEHPPELYWGKLKKQQLTRLTFSNPELARLPLAKQEEIRWQASDGLEITGLLMKPLDYEPGKKYPLIVQVHGGPESAYVNTWNTSYSRWSQLLAARGYVVFMPNYRGSTGRGVQYAKADHQDMAGKEFGDVLDGINFLIEQGLVDRDRVGIGGWSYGGYFSAWAATRHSQRFKAAVVGAAITNWHSFMGTTDIPYEEALVHWDLWCYDEPELCWQRSPMAHINNANTPALIIHGARDLRVPVSQGWELYTGLSVRDVPTEFVIYPREPHGLREDAHQVDCIRRALEWFDRYVKGDTGTN